jgi:lysophospholipase L1-like esterase
MARRIHDVIVESYLAGISTVLVIVILAGIGGAMIYKSYLQPSKPTEPPENPYPNAPQSVVALGDSFASGEGAQAFWKSSGTCHRAWQSYAYTIASQYQLSLAFPACSGAVINDLDHESSNSLAPQIDAVRKTTHIKFVLVQIGGNDAHFGDLVAACLKANFHLGPPCAGQGFLDRLPNVETALVKIYGEVSSAARGAPVFVMGYPNPFGPQYCTASEVSLPDWTFLSQTFIPSLDNTIAEAAQTAHVHYVPMLDAFAGYALCQLPVGEAALNTISYLSDLPRHDSFHPNAVGQLLMANRIESILRSNSITIPTESSPQQNTPTTNPPNAIPQIVALKPQADMSPCHAGTPAGTLYPTDITALARVALTGVLPASTICYRIDDGPWHNLSANASGNVEINAGTPHPTSTEVIFRDPYKTWTRALYRVATRGT